MTMQRFLFSWSPRFTTSRSSQLAGHVEWPHVTQLGVPLSSDLVNYQTHAWSRDLSHWVTGSHPYWRIDNSRGQHHWRAIPNYRVPYYRLCQSCPDVPLGNRTHATMSSVRIKSPKRERNPSGAASRNSQPKVQKTEEVNTSRVPSAPGRGLTQHDWPQSAEDCQWRRAGKEFREKSPEVKQVSRWDQQGRRTCASSASASHSSQCDKRVIVTSSKCASARIPPHPSASCQPVGQDQNNSPLTSTDATGFTRLHPAASNSLEGRRGIHSSAANAGQGQNAIDVSSSRTYTKRLWFDVQKQGSQQNKPSQQSERSSRDNNQPFEFSVMSYNILAQGLLESNMYLYQHCSQDVLPWEFRKQNILAEIKQADADVICLQEVESEHFRNFFKPELGTLGYAAIYKKRTGDKGDGCATFYKRSVFRHVFHSQLEYQRQAGCLDRDNVAVIVMLQPKGLPSAHQLCVANTHLLWNPRRGDVKLAQLSLLFAEIERMSHTDSTAPIPEGTYHPVVLCGDFNSLPHCPLYKFVKNGHLNYEGMAMVDVSGQENGRSRYMESPLWPQEIGITQRCRYVHRDSNSASSVTGNLGRMKKASSASDNGSEWDESEQTEIVCQPGDLHHPFFFSSVYEHKHGNREVTTNHTKTNCTVDYVFYTWSSLPDSPRGKSADARARTPRFSSSLSVTRRLSLFTDNEMRSMGGLPNANWSSDHLSLQARFVMTPIT